MSFSKRLPVAAGAVLLTLPLWPMLLPFWGIAGLPEQAVGGSGALLQPAKGQLREGQHLLAPPPANTTSAALPGRFTAVAFIVPPNIMHGMHRHCLLLAVPQSMTNLSFHMKRLYERILLPYERVGLPAQPCIASL